MHYLSFYFKLCIKNIIYDNIIKDKTLLLIFSYSFLLGDGVVTLWDIGAPKLPTYDGANPQKLMRLFPDYGDVLNIVWSGDNRWLLAGTAAGLVGWNIEDEKVKKEGEKYK